MRAARALLGLGAAFALAQGCDGEGAKTQPPTSVAETAEAEARRLLSPAEALPDRARVVALSDAVAIASSREGATARGGELARLAGDLRARAWRVDRVEADAREASELYAAAARVAPSSEPACEADRARALLLGELMGDAAVTWRELVLARARHAPGAVDVPGSDRAPTACLRAFDVQLDRLVAFRPRGEALAATLRAAAEQAAPSVSASATAPGASAAPAVASVDPPAAPGPGRDLVIAPTGAAFEKGPVRVTKIERYGSEQGGRVVVELSAPTTFEVGVLPADPAHAKDNRVFVDVARASSKGIAREMEVGGAIRRVRTGRHEGGTRIVLDLQSALYRRIFYLPDPFRVVIDVTTRPPERAGAAAAQGKTGREVRRVVIDAGHGGNDTGAVGPTGLREKDVTLDIAHRAAPILAQELKVEVMLTRDTDAYVPLDERTARANAFHADLFVSVHCNASENGRAHGVQTFHLDRVRDPKGFAAAVAARENAGHGGRPLDPAALDDQLGQVLSGLNVGDMAGRSSHFADLVHRSALASLGERYPGTKDQGVKGAGFFVLVGADMPAVLFETAFISNPSDEQLLATADYRQKMADAIVNAVRAYRAGL